MRDTLKVRLSPSLVVAVIALFVALAGTTWAGTGGNFILGKQNNADHTTQLSSPTSAAALKSVNTGTGPALSGASGGNNGIVGTSAAPNMAGVYALNDGSSGGPGLRALSVHSAGVVGQGVTAGGSFNSIGPGDGVQGASNAAGKSGVYAHHDSSSFGYGVFANAINGVGVSGAGSAAGGRFDGQNTGDGVQGASSAHGKSGVWGHHDGASHGYGVFAQSTNGPAIGMLGNKNSPPLTLDGQPFPSATAVYHPYFVHIPSDKTWHPVMALNNITPGTYVLLASLDVVMDRDNRLECELAAGADTDDKLVLGDVAQVPMSFMLFHTFTSPGSALIQCITPDDYTSVIDLKIIAIRIAGGTNTQVP